MSVAAAVIYAPGAGDQPDRQPTAPDRAVVVFLAGTAVLQTGYFVFLLRAYRAATCPRSIPSGGARAPCWPRWAASPYSASGPAPPGWPASACW
jgi:hypothetical protein